MPLPSELKQAVIDVVLDPKTAYTVGGTTTAGGLSEIWLNIPWPAIATAMGSILSFGLFIIQLWRFVLDREKRLLEIKILESKIHEDQPPAK